MDRDACLPARAAGARTGVRWCRSGGGGSAGDDALPEPHTEIRARSPASTPSERPRRSVGPSRHKLGLLTWASAYAVITAILAALGPTLASCPLALRTLVLSGVMVVIRLEVGDDRR
jgi:hypothetical protein